MKQKVFYWTGWVSVTLPIIVTLALIILISSGMNGQDPSGEISPAFVRVLTYLVAAFFTYQYLVLRWYVVRALAFKLFDIATVFYIGSTIFGLLGFFETQTVENQLQTPLADRLLFSTAFIIIGAFVMAVKSDLFGMRKALGISEILCGIAYLFDYAGLSSIAFLVFYIAMCRFFFRASEAFKLEAKQANIAELIPTGAE